jgi:fluoride ion exporter CrcB/FEX
MFEAQQLGEDGEWSAMRLYLLGSMVGGLAATGLGWLLGGALE